MHKTNWLRLVEAIVVCLLVGQISSLFTMSGVFGWYMEINKPSFTPPDWLFAPVWTILFILMGIAVFLVLETEAKKKNGKKGVSLEQKWEAVAVFGLQLLFNFLWSVFFFCLHSPAAALVDIVVLWLLIILTIFYFSRLNRVAAWLLVPYLLWVSFAAILNASIWFLN